MGRRLMLVAAVLMVVSTAGVTTTASAHGQCQISGRGPWDTSGGAFVKAQGIYDCNGTKHTVSLVYTQLQKRVSGSWVNRGNGVANDDCRNRDRCQATDTETCSVGYWRMTVQAKADLQHEDGPVTFAQRYIDCNN